MSIRLLIADDHEVVRAGLKSLLADVRDIQIVAEAADGEEAVRLAHRHRPQVVLLDVRMVGGDGLAALGRLREELPGVPGDHVQRVRQSHLHGAGRRAGRGRLPGQKRHARRDRRRHSAGRRRRIALARDGLRRAGASRAPSRAAADLDTALTKREAEVLKQLALGLSNKEIAQALDISYETVKEHVQHILRKLGVADRTQAAVWAVRKGLA